jgi:hypothetical protein
MTEELYKAIHKVFALLDQDIASPRSMEMIIRVQDGSEKVTAAFAELPALCNQRHTESNDLSIVDLPSGQNGVYFFIS